MDSLGRMGLGASAWGRRHQRENGWGRENGRQAGGFGLANQMGRTVVELKCCRYLLEGGLEKEE